MKKVTTLLFLVMLTISYTFAQNIVGTDPENKNVVLEEFTGIHCGFCPQGHAIGQALKDAHPDDVFLINIHAGGYAVPSGSEPDFRTPWGAAIDGQADVAGYPAGTVNRHLFPGWSQGSGTAMNRGQWTAASNIVMDEASYLNVGLEATIVTSTRQLVVEVEVYYTGDSPNAANSLSVAILQDNIYGPQSGGGAGNNYKHMHMLRYLMTGQWGVEITETTEGSLYSNTFAYELPDYYNGVPVVLEDLEIVAFVTEESTQEIISGNHAPEITFVTSNNYDAAVTSVLVPQTYCSEELNPVVDLKNYGEIALTSLEFTYSINGGDPATYSWTGNLAQLESEVVELPTLEFIPTNNNNVSIECSLPNGEQDQLPQNDYFNGSGEGSQNFPESINFGVKIDANPEYITWSIKSSDGTVIAEGGPYANNGFQISPVAFPEDGCYELMLNDASGQGLSGGFYLITNSDNDIIWEGNDFTYSATAQLARGMIVDIDEELTSDDVSVHPNPVSNIANIEFNLSNRSDVTIAVFDILGKNIKTIHNGELDGGSHRIQLGTSDMNQGVYFTKIQINSDVITKKILVTK
jgi:outer membrane protein Omp28/type IX secretion system substrate protein